MSEGVRARQGGRGVDVEAPRTRSIAQLVAHFFNSRAPNVGRLVTLSAGTAADASAAPAARRETRILGWRKLKKRGAERGI